jgi:nucleoside-diphosphate kinase
MNFHLEFSLPSRAQPRAGFAGPLFFRVLPLATVGDQGYKPGLVLAGIGREHQRSRQQPFVSNFFMIRQPRGAAMAVERTLSIIKPDATARNITGKINAFFEDGGLRIVAQKRLRLTKDHAEQFYAVHAERPFYGELCAYMTSGPVVVQVLEGENAIARNREIMGATNPANAAEGTIRKACGLNVQENTVHGSDSPENALKEIGFLFSETEIPG